MAASVVMSSLALKPSSPLFEKTQVVKGLPSLARSNSALRVSASGVKKIKTATPYEQRPSNFPSLFMGNMKEGGEQLHPPPISLTRCRVCSWEPPPPTTYPSHLLNSHKCHHSLPLLKQTHAQLIKYDLSDDNYIAGTLMKHYSNPHHLTFSSALKVFDQVPHPHVFLFNSLIKAYFEDNQPLKCISSYRRMLTHGSKPNKYTFPTLFNACTTTGAVAEATQLHAQVIKLSLGHDRYTTSAAIQMYATLGHLAKARRMLDTGVGLDPVCWNAMIDGLLKNGEVTQAREMFDVMPSRNTGSWNAMVSGYARHGFIDEARTLFDQMPKRDEVSWSAMIDAYIQCGRSLDALAVFRHMLSEKAASKKFVLSSVIAACADVGALEQGRWIHAYVKKNSMGVDAIVGTSLIDMYAKCGRLDLARQVFEEIACKRVFCWNAMIGGLAMHGHGTNALELFRRMRGEGFVPNAITLVGILNACAHAGMVDDANKIFTSMEREYGVTPMVEHYGCMVNLLGRAGQFNEAEELIASMPMKPNAAVWGALLGGCRIHGNVELGKKVGERLIELEPENSGRYTLLSNIYAREGIWDDVLKVRKLMKDRGVKTIPGSSLIEVDGVVHEFIVGDGSHPSSEVVYLMLKEIVSKLKLEGYAPNTSDVFFDIDEEEKESALCYHSEKLAIAFGLLNTSPGTMIRIVKNLRVCEDCHSATKLISRLYNREIIVRDRARFHHFRDGICSCMDFW